MHTLPPFPRSCRVLLLLTLALLSVTRLRAQAEPTPSPSPSAATVERTVYTPYEKLSQVFENEGRGVFLPYREFLDLWNKVNLPADLKKNTPPVDGVLASARYTGHIDGDAAIFDAQLQFEALKDGWSRVPLGGADLNIAEVKPAPGSAAAPVLHLAGDGYEAILPEKGSYPVALTVLGKVTRDAGKSALALRLPRTAAAQFELTIPGTGLDFTLWPASAFTTKEENDATRLTAFFGTTQEVYIFWHTRAVETTLPALVFAEDTVETSVNPGALRTVANLDFRLLRAPVGAFELLVPAGQQVLGVEGAGLRDWNLAPGPDGRQRVAVNLATPAHEKYQLRVTLEAPIAALPAKLPVPTLEVAGAEGQSGTVTLTADPALTVAIDPREGVTQQGVTDPSAARPVGAFLGAYRFLRLPYALDLDVRAAQPVVEVSSGTLFTVAPDTLEMYSVQSYKVTKAGIFSASVDVPAAFAHVEAKSDAVESFSIVKPTPAAPPLAAGYQRLEVLLKERRTGDFYFVVTGDAPRSKPEDPVSLAVPHAVGVARDEGKVAVAIHQSLDPKTTDPGDLRPEDVHGLSTPQPGDPTNTPVALGFSYRGAAAKPAQLAFTLRKPRVNAELASRVSLRESLVAYQWTVAYTIEYAGVDELVLDAPPEVADDLQFSGDDIKEKTREGGRWHIRLQQKKLGRYDLKINLERPLPGLQPGHGATVDWPELKTVGPFHETGTVAVVKADNLEITRATPTGLELIDPAELPDFAPRAISVMNATQPRGESADIFLAYRYAAHPAALRLEFSKNEFLPVPTAIVTYAVLNTTLTTDRAETTEAIYWLRNNGRQFLSVVLPANGQMLSDVFVNGQPQQPSRRPDKSALLVRLPARAANAPAASSDEAPISVRLVYAVAADPAAGQGGMGRRGRLHVEPPTLEETRVLQTQVSLYLPADYCYVDFAGPMREVYDRRGWNGLREFLAPFVPALGPDVTRTPNAEWQEPPTLPPATGGGFDSPVAKAGTPVVLRRLDAPAPVDIGYRSLGWANTVEALAFFLTLACGLALLGSPRGVRLGYFFLVGVGALIVAGAVAPRAAGLWTAAYLGVFVAVLVWLAAGSWRWLRNVARRFAERRRRFYARVWAALHRPRRNPPPPTPPPVPPVTPGAV